MHTQRVLVAFLFTLTACGSDSAVTAARKYVVTAQQTSDTQKPGSSLGCAGFAGATRTVTWWLIQGSTTTLVAPWMKRDQSAIFLTALSTTSVYSYIDFEPYGSTSLAGVAENQFSISLAASSDGSTFAGLLTHDYGEGTINPLPTICSDTWNLAGVEQD